MLQFGVRTAWCKSQGGACLINSPDATKRNISVTVVQPHTNRGEWLRTASYFLKSRMAMTMMMMRTTASTGPITHNISGCSIPWAIFVVTWIGSEYGLAENVICKGKEKRESAGAWEPSHFRATCLQGVRVRVFRLSLKTKNSLHITGKRHRIWENK